MKDKQFEYTLEEIISEKFGLYSKYIIQERAIPDVRDGLKPVQRRIIYSMEALGLNYKSPYKKSARIVGEVIGKYHPHGDSSVYDALVRMSQNWKMRYPLIDVHGNNGSIDGDPPAAMRYTETKLHKITSFLINDTNEDIVKFNLNFDDSEVEPSIMTGLFPNLLLNGSTGIASGYATNIPPHNIDEVINATIELIKNPDLEIDEILNFIKGPDFPTGGIIQGIDNIKSIYKEGKGSLVVRSKLRLEDNKIIVDEIPFEIEKENLIKKIDTFIQKEDSNIKSIVDQTDRNGLRIEIEIDNPVQFNSIRQELFKNTPLQINYNVNLVCIVNKKPMLCNIKNILSAYIKHQKYVYTNIFKKKLKKDEKRLNIVEGLVKTTIQLDDIITLIRNSKGKNESIDKLVRIYDYNKEQAEAIVNLQLYRLSSSDITKLFDEQQNLNDSIFKLNRILNNSNLLNDEIIKSLNEIKYNFSDNRKTQIEQKIEEIEIPRVKTMINKKIFLSLSRDGYINLSEEEKIDKPNINDIKLKENDELIAYANCNTLNRVGIFTNKGQLIVLKLKELEISNQHISSYVKILDNQKVIAAFIINDNFKSANYIIGTNKGYCKKINITHKDLTKQKVINIYKMQDDDKVINVLNIKNENANVLFYNSKNKIIKYNLQEIPYLTFGAKGVKSMMLNEDEIVKNFTIINDVLYGFTNSNNQIILINESDILLSKRQNQPKKIKELNKDINNIFTINGNSNIIIYDNKKIDYIVTSKYILEYKPYAQFDLSKDTDLNIKYINTTNLEIIL